MVSASHAVVYSPNARRAASRLPRHYGQVASLARDRRRLDTAIAVVAAECDVVDGLCAALGTENPRDPHHAGRWTVAA